MSNDTVSANWTDQLLNEDGTVKYWLPIASVFAMQTINYVFCQIVKDNSHIDTLWSISFIVPNTIMMYVLHSAGTKLDLRTMITTFLLFVWGMRLAIHIGCRHVEEDYRYVAMRTRFMKGGLCCYYVCAYLYIFVMQGALSLIVNAPVLYTTANSSALTAAGTGKPLGWTDYVGYAIFAIGLIFEWAGDLQLQAHIKNEDPNKGKFCKTGLWRYTRHPNYFGDACLWWGFYFMALAAAPGGYWTFYGPLVMTLLLRFVSGVALLERKQSKHEEFAAYAAQTNAFVPWFATPTDDDFKKAE